MTHGAHADYEMQAVLPATLEDIERFLHEFRQRTKSLARTFDPFSVELLVREALTNAVVHGSHTDPERRVRCSLRLRGGRLLVAVEDDGEGFDWRSRWQRAAAIPACSGRGIEILRKYADRVRYNERGNTVTLMKRF